jgi:hypothetical protein
MKLGFPTRGPDTDRECPECGSSQHTQRSGETYRTETGLVVEEKYVCHPRDGCGHSWTVDTYGEGIYRD